MIEAVSQRTPFTGYAMGAAKKGWGRRECSRQSAHFQVGLRSAPVDSSRLEFPLFSTNRSWRSHVFLGWCCCFSVLGTRKKKLCWIINVLFLQVKTYISQRKINELKEATQIIKPLILTCMEELGSWFCGSLRLDEFILDTETEAARVQAAPRPEGKGDCCCWTLSLFMSAHGWGLSVQPAFCRVSYLLKAKGLIWKSAPCPLRFWFCVSSLKLVSVTRHRPSSFSCRYLKGKAGKPVR